MTYDSARSVVQLNGGSDSRNHLLGDTWEWNGKDWAFVSSSGPGPKAAHAMAYDSARPRTVLFGGAGSRQLIPKLDCNDGNACSVDF